MTQVLVNETLRSMLHNLSQPLEFRDENGRILGRFVPSLDPSEYNLEPQISAEELRRRRQAKEKSYTTAEVLAYLEKL